MSPATIRSNASTARSTSARVVVATEADADQAGHPALVAVRGRSTHARWAALIQAKQVGDVRVGAEAAAAHADAVLVAEDGGDQTMVEAVDGERDDADRVDRRRDRRAVQAQAGDPVQPVRRRSRVSSASWAAIRSSPIVVEGRRRRGEATAPRTFGLPASSRSGRSAHATASGDGDDGAAAAMVGAGANHVAGPIERAGAERGVHLVRRQGDEVEVARVVVGAHVDRAVGGQLGGVDEDAPADGVHLRCQVVDRLARRR